MCVGSIFSRNTAISKGGVLLSGDCNGSCILYLDQNNFTFNVAKYGGVFETRTSNVMIIHKSTFLNSKAHRIGGVGYIFDSTITVIESIFNHNQAGRHAGAL